MLGFLLGVDETKSEEREKRDESKIKPRTTCLISAVGDYDFFKGWCKESYINCASTIVSGTHEKFACFFIRSEVCFSNFNSIIFGKMLYNIESGIEARIEHHIC